MITRRSNVDKQRNGIAKKKKKKLVRSRNVRIAITRTVDGKNS